jgi:hypothetical protein
MNNKSFCGVWEIRAAAAAAAQDDASMASVTHPREKELLTSQIGRG